MERVDMAGPAEAQILPVRAGSAGSWTRGWVAGAGRLCRFAVVSGAGWCLDLLVFSVGVHLGAPPELANVVSAGSAVVFVYWTSVRRIFHCREDRLLRSFYGYLLLQVAIIATSSWLIAAIDRHLAIEPVLIKIALTPFCFLANYCGMILLTSDKGPV
jgi:putative flippase GtrA